MRLLSATVLASLALIGHAMPVIQINTGPQWGVQPQPAPQPQPSNPVENFTPRDSAPASAQQPGAEVPGSQRPTGRPVAFSVDELQTQQPTAPQQGAPSVDPQTGLPITNPQAVASPAAATPQTAFTQPGAPATGAAPQQPSVANQDPTGWSQAMANRQPVGQATQPATTGFQQTGFTGVGGIPGATPFAAAGAPTTGGGFVPASGVSPQANPEDGRVSALQQAANGNSAAAGQIPGQTAFNQFGTPGLTGQTNPFGAPVVGAAPPTGGAVGDPTQAGGFMTNGGMPGSNTAGMVPGANTGIPGQQTFNPGFNTGTQFSGQPSFPGQSTFPGAPTTGGNAGLGVTTRRRSGAVPPVAN